MMGNAVKKNVFFIGAIFGALTISVPADSSVKVAGESIEKSSICPGASTSKCVINNVGTTTTYIGASLKYISLNAAGDPILEDYLGHLFTDSMVVGQPYCQNVSTNVIKQYADKSGIPYIRENAPYANHFHIKQNAQKVIGLGVSLDAKAIAAEAGVPKVYLEQVAAAIATAYKSARSKDLELSGWFRYYEINPEILTVFNSVNAPTELKECRKWLVQNNRKLTWTLTGYKLDQARVTSEFRSTFSSKLEAAVKGKADATQIAAITAMYSNAVERLAEVRISPTFGLLTVGRAPL